MHPNRAKRKRAYRRGILAEYWACAYLWLRGYRLVQRRYKVAVGEIDMIVRNRQYLVAVEVKAHKTLLGGEVLTKKQQQRITRAFAFFIAKHPEYARLQPRFDLIWCAPFGRVYHTKHAFDAA